ncbi:SDR family oxidoreductase [Paenibacillus pabuli]|uniref:type I polyketide synthase n=1 Tax=Paenibacillus pabuli TaxID=1472 RepID=UPI003CF67D06
MRMTERFIFEQVSKRALLPELAKEMLMELRDMAGEGQDDIAIIGMAGRYPGSVDIQEYWDNLLNGMNCVSTFPSKRREDINPVLEDPALSLALFKQRLDQGMVTDDIYGHGGFLDQIDLFDAHFFSIPSTEAKFMEPHQRLMLETVYDSMEDAGYGGDCLNGSKTGVFIGRDHTDLPFYKLMAEQDLMHLTGSYTGILASRISYLFNLKGPAAVIDTACSSGLVSLHEACRALKDKRCDLAIAGGIKLIYVPIREDSMFNMIASNEGKVRTFDKHAAGTVISEGVGAVLLKPLKAALKDGDNIRAVIRATATNNDGTSNGITAPNSLAQEDLLTAAWKEANISPESISYIEAHGTGTLLGDPIEAKAITNAIRKFTDRKQFCAIGSVKSNIGHTVAASGLAGISKTVLALQNKIIPPSINFLEPNPYIHYTDSPFYVSDKSEKWETSDGPRRAGVSSFGFSGTNCHIILEEAPEQHRVGDQPDNYKDGPYIFTLSAKSDSSLRGLIQKYKQFIDKGIKDLIQDICFTSSVGRGHYSHRIAFLVNDIEDFENKITIINDKGYLNLEHNEVYYGTADSFNQNKSNLKQEVDTLMGSKKDKLHDRSSLLVLCRLYIQGANVDWSGLYEFQNRKRISLPVYVYDRQRFWAQRLKTGFGMINETNPPSIHVENMLYEEKWIAVDHDAIQYDEVINGKTLIFRGDTVLSPSILKAFKEKGISTVEVSLSEAFQKLSHDHFSISGKLGDYERLFSEVDGIERIIHVMSVDGKVSTDSIEQLRIRKETGVISLFYLLKAMKKVRGRQKCEIILISDFVHSVTECEDTLKPDHSALFGLSQVLPQEYPEITCKCIDIDELFDASLLMKELSSNSMERIVAYREGQRYQQEIRAIEQQSLSENAFTLKTDGIYMITGGTGGIGLELAKHLSAKENINIALISRKGLPERRLWDEIIESNTNEPMMYKLKLLIDLEKKGSNIVVIQGDVSNEHELSNITHELRRKFSRINGIIHAAGVAGKGLLIRKSEDLFSEVLSPKIDGTWLLHSLTLQDQLDFFVMFSSNMTLVGVGGQGDYTAANSYLDSFAQYRNRKIGNTVSIKWPAWKEIGMAVDHEAIESQLFDALETETGLEIFDQLIGSKKATIIVGKKEPVKYKQSSEKVSGNQDMQVKLSGVQENEPFMSIAYSVAQFWGKIFDINNITLTDDFFELGGHSLLAIRLEAELEQAGFIIGDLDINNYRTFGAFVKALYETNKNNSLIN